MPSVWSLTEDPPEIHEAETYCTDPAHQVDLLAEPYYRDAPGALPAGVNHYWRNGTGWVWNRPIAVEGQRYPSYENITCTFVPPPGECGCWSCEHEARLENGGCDCDECRPEVYGIEGIQNYSFKPRARFYGDGPTYLGVELEVESGDDGLVNAVDDILPLVGKRAYLKEDGSLDYGFELVTHPHDLAAHHHGIGWSEIMTTLSRNGMVAGDSCGLHVHVSRAAFDCPSHAFRWQSLIYRNQATVTKVARRTSTQWAAWPSADTRKWEVPIVAKRLHTPWDMRSRDNFYAERYRAINVLNDATFEMRVFASTTNVDELFSAVELVASSVEYTRGMRSHDVLAKHALTMPAYGEFIRSDESYARLAHAI